MKSFKPTAQDGGDEMDEACGDGWAELQSNDSPVGEIRFHGGEKSPSPPARGRRRQQPARSCPSDPQTGDGIAGVGLTITNPHIMIRPSLA
jgi:hypothetical protein